MGRSNKLLKKIKSAFGNATSTGLGGDCTLTANNTTAGNTLTIGNGTTNLPVWTNQNGSTFLTTNHTGQTVWLTNGGSSSRTLTAEEIKRISELEQEHVVAIKQAKIDAFKKLSPKYRQLHIDMLRTSEYITKIHQLDVPPSEELLTLRSNNVFLTGNVTGHCHVGNWTTINSASFASIDELEKAHCEACTEELITNEGDDE